MKILIVDDDAIVVQCCIRILELEGIKVSSADSVERGMKLLSAEGPSASFDLILTDAKMPGQDGFEMIRLAREIQPAVPIIMMTGDLTFRTMEKNGCSGADTCIAKPFTPNELLDAVRQTLLQQQGVTGK